MFGKAASSNKQKVVKKDSKPLPPNQQKMMKKTGKAKQDELQDPTSFAPEEVIATLCLVLTTTLRKQLHSRYNIF